MTSLWVPSGSFLVFLGLSGHSFGHSRVHFELLCAPMAFLWAPLGGFWITLDHLGQFVSVSFSCFVSFSVSFFISFSCSCSWALPLPLYLFGSQCTPFARTARRRYCRTKHDFLSSAGQLIELLRVTWVVQSLSLPLPLLKNILFQFVSRFGPMCQSLGKTPLDIMAMVVDVAPDGNPLHQEIMTDHHTFL